MKAGIMLTLGAIALSSCGNDAAAPADPQTPAATVGVTPAAAPNAATVALGLTEAQLLDADLLDNAGKELAGVEGLVRNATGEITGLRVEIDDTDPDRFVTVPIAGLTTVQNGNDWDIRSTLTRAELLAMPAAE